MGSECLRCVLAARVYVISARLSVSRPIFRLQNDTTLGQSRRRRRPKTDRTKRYFEAEFGPVRFSHAT